MRDPETKILSAADATYFMRRRLPPFLAQIFESGHGPGISVENNVKAFEQVCFRPRAAVRYPDRTTETTLFGHRLQSPLFLCPVGALRTGAPGHGEIAVARAAGQTGVAQGVSSFTGYPIEDVVRATSAPVHFQLFYLGGRANTERMVRRAREAGCAGLIVTVDIAAPGGQREIPYRRRMAVPTGRGLADAVRIAPQLIGHLPWLWDFVADSKPADLPMVPGEGGEPTPLLQGVAHQLDEIPVWDDLAWLRELWDGPLILKGIMTVEDAIRARDHGVQGIFVSNHGGNHLDGSLPPLQVLPAIARAVGDDLDIVLDGGVRRGTDVVKALALGADAVGLGRAYVHALMAAGEAGVLQMIRIIAREVDETLSSIGAPSLAALDQSYVELPAHWAPQPWMSQPSAARAASMTPSESVG